MSLQNCPSNPLTCTIGFQIVHSVSSIEPTRNMVWGASNLSVDALPSTFGNSITLEMHTPRSLAVMVAFRRMKTLIGVVGKSAPSFWAVHNSMIAVFSSDATTSILAVE